MTAPDEPSVSARSLGPPDPLDLPPRSDVSPNPNDAVGSTGPNVPVAGDPSAQEQASGGFGAAHVMYDAANPPLEAAAWAGWPTQWQTPNTNSLGATVGGLWGADLDVIWMATDYNARTLADMPAYPRRDGALLPVPAWLNNPQPQLYRSWGDLMKQIVWSYFVAGEAFLVATSRFADGWPRTFCLVPPMMVNAELLGGVPAYWINGQPATEDLLHIKYLGWPDDARGHGPLEVAGARMTAARALAKYGTDLAVNGGIPWAVLSHKYRLTQAQADRLKMQWIMSSRTRNGAPVILDQDMQLNQLMVTPKDMALSEMQGFTEARLSVLMGVPPTLLGLPSGEDSMTYRNDESIFERHWRTTLKPAAHTIYAAISGWAMPAGTDCEVNAESYVRPGPVDRVTYYEKMSALKAITVNEIRRNENLPPLPGGDSIPKPAPVPPQLQPAGAGATTEGAKSDDPAAGLA